MAKTIKKINTKLNNYSDKFDTFLFKMAEILL